MKQWTKENFERWKQRTATQLLSRILLWIKWVLIRFIRNRDVSLDCNFWGYLQYLQDVFAMIPSFDILLALPNDFIEIKTLRIWEKKNKLKGVILVFVMYAQRFCELMNLFKIIIRCSSELSIARSTYFLCYGTTLHSVIISLFTTQRSSWQTQISTEQYWKLINSSSKRHS